MTPTIRAIHDTCETLGAAAPKVREYTNAISVAMRNAEGHRVALLIGHKDSAETVATKIRLAYRSKSDVDVMTYDELMQRVSGADI